MNHPSQRDKFVAEVFLDTDSLAFTHKMNSFLLLLVVVGASVATVQSWSLPKPAQKLMKSIVTVAGAVNIALLASGSPALADSVPAVGWSKIDS